jgi:thiol-disulfide isomerase/thioredoxin
MKKINVMVLLMTLLVMLLLIMGCTNRAESNADVIEDEVESNVDVIEDEVESNVDVIEDEVESNVDVIEDEVESNTDVIEDEVETNNDVIEEIKDMGWKEIELFDVLSSETFKVNDFAGKPILVESFAVWCPTCTKQQRIFKEFIEQDTTGVIHVSLDTDPNEDKQQVINHALSNGFDWYYSISPIELTQKLIDIYGIGIVNAPSVPVILVCEDLSEKLLQSGLKSVDELKEEIANGCN